MPDSLVIRGAREHNLKGVSLELPRDKLIVFTGLSGSGKSSLAFDTIYAEGQRRYVESLSSYARQFLGQMDKPDVDFIEGLSPAISIDQKSASRNPRSTVGTVTEVYDYLRLLYARIGEAHCTNCGRRVTRQSPSQIVDQVMALPEETRFAVLAPVVRGRKGEYSTLLDDLARQGYARVRVDGVTHELAERSSIDLGRYETHTIEVVVDRLIRRDGIERRLTDSIETALRLAEGVAAIQLLGSGRAENAALRQAGTAESLAVLTERERSARTTRRRQAPAGASPAAGTEAGGGRSSGGKSSRAGGRGGRGSGAAAASAVALGDDVDEPEDEELLSFSEHLACTHCGLSFDELAPRNFSFNSPYGACPACLGLGTRFEVDPELVVPNPDLSLSQGAIAPWAGARTEYFSRIIKAVADELKVGTDVAWRKLPKTAQKAFMHGMSKKVQVSYKNRYGTVRRYETAYEGVIPWLQRRHSEAESDYQREQIEGYMREVPCAACGGARLKPESLAVTVGGRNIAELAGEPIGRSSELLGELELTDRQVLIAARVLKEIRARLQFLIDVGLDYLSLARSAATLAGGEAQRIRLASQIGSGLVGVLYVLDEPSIGLHQRDNRKLIETLLRLRDLGNTVIVVEHDEETIRIADHVVDIGPGAGEHGGEVVVSGSVKDLLDSKTSITGRYLSGAMSIEVPSRRRRPVGGKVVVKGAREHNLQGVDAAFPLGCFVAVTGVSGSGKSTLVNDILHRALMQRIYHSKTVPGRHHSIEGAEALDKVIDIDQSPIGRTPRSNPATYTGVFDKIRTLFSQTSEAKVRGYLPGRFSFNVSGGRCEACAGDGTIKIEMHFLPDVYVPCEVCKGARYNRDTLEVLWRGRSIADVLDLSCEEALEVFAAQPVIARHLQTLVDVGLSYVRLGQPAPTLSGGEAQRVKLASELAKRATGKTMYILDEPTTGLHFEDVRKLLGVLQRLVDQGNTVVVIEHNLDVIKSADWILDLGPEGGHGGGRIVAEGPPEKIAKVAASYTGKFLAPLLAG